jgi:hypothetical protein
MSDLVSNLATVLAQQGVLNVAIIDDAICARDLNVEAAVCFDASEGSSATKDESPLFPVVRLPRAARARCNQPPKPCPVESQGLALTREQGATEK